MRPVPESAAAVLREALRLAFPYIGRCLGAAAGFAAGWFGVLAGFLLGYMLDEARAEAAIRRALTDFFRDPDGPPPREPEEGLAAAAALALGGEWPGTGGLGIRRELFASLCAALRPPRPGTRKELARILDAAEGLPRQCLAGLARHLSLNGSAQARRLLADFAFGLAARDRGESGELSRESEAAIRSALADCGLEPAELEEARAAAFPAYRDPWSVLGLPPGSPREDVKRAYRILSRRLHPDAGGGGSAEGFRELRKAYEALVGS
jgi:hypothetical protein